MLFNSLSFILLFLPVSLLGFYGLAWVGNRWASAWLVAVSLVFYSWWQSSLLVLLCGSIAFNYFCGFLILRSQKREKVGKTILVLGICGNLFLLCYYKYLFSIINWLGFHGLIPLTHSYSMILPLGISFFTFTQIGYLIDCTGGGVKKTPFLDYSLFVTFFPHLIAGPILHHREMMPQFADPRTYRFRWENLAVGMTLFMIGLTKKVVFADQFIPVVAAAFGDTKGLTFFPAWQGALSYSLQLYFDFSGYSDMAIGLAKMFGIRFPANFNSPYCATSIIDFWQRWHMTLTRYLTLYLYTPIALWVSHRRLAQHKSISRRAISTPEGFASMIAFPTLFTMLLAGIWHGAGLQFLVFGLLHGIYLTINHAYRSFGPRVDAKAPHPVLKWAATFGKVALTYLAVVVAQIFFRAASVHDAVRLLQGMCGVYGMVDPHTLPAFSFHRFGDEQLKEIWPAFALLFFFLLVWIFPNSLQLLARYQPSLSDIRPSGPLAFIWRPTLAWAVLFGCAAALALLSATGLTEFIYFRF